MRFLIPMLFLICLPLYAANPSYNNFNTNQFLRVGNNLFIKGNGVTNVNGTNITIGTLGTNSFTTRAYSDLAYKVWTNDGTFVFLSGYTNYQDSVHEDPPWVIKTNGSFAVGRNVRQDTALNSPSVPYISMMTDSNEIETVAGTWQVIDSENYGKVAGAYIAVKSAWDGYALLSLDVKQTNNLRTTISLQSGPYYDKFIESLVNFQSVASLGTNGSWNAVSYRGLGGSSPANVGGITANLTVLTNGANTATMHFTNGVLMSITAP